MSLFIFHLIGETKLCAAAACDHEFLPKAHNHQYCCTYCRQLPRACADCGMHTRRERCLSCSTKITLVETRVCAAAWCDRRFESSKWGPQHCSVYCLVHPLLCAECGAQTPSERCDPCAHKVPVDETRVCAAEACHRTFLPVQSTQEYCGFICSKYPYVCEVCEARRREEVCRRCLSIADAQALKLRAKKSAPPKARWDNLDYVEHWYASRDAAGYSRHDEYIGFQTARRLIHLRDQRLTACPLCDDALMMPHIHHIDHDNNNQSPDNLISLCADCNVIHESTAWHNGTAEEREALIHDLRTQAIALSEKMPPKWWREFTELQSRVELALGKESDLVEAPEQLGLFS